MWSVEPGETWNLRKETTMRNLLAKFVRDERGLETVEYAIITGLIVAATITAIATLGTWVSGQFSGLNTKLGAK